MYTPASCSFSRVIAAAGLCFLLDVFQCLQIVIFTFCPDYVIVICGRALKTSSLHYHYWKFLHFYSFPAVFVMAMVFTAVGGETVKGEYLLISFRMELDGLSPVDLPF